METEHIHIEGVDTYRRVLLFGSLIFSVISLLVLLGGPRICPNTDLVSAIWLAFGVQLSVFILLLLHYINLGSCFKTLGRGIWLYYIYVVGTMAVL